MSDTEALLRVVGFGLDVQQFSDSPIGRYLRDRCENEIAQAVIAFKSADPVNQNEIRKLQNQIYRAESVMNWLDEAIQEGINAERLATQEDE